MPRKIKLSPEQNEILRLLEEAGEETLGTLLNTLRVRPDPQAGVPHEFQAAIAGLFRLGFVAWCPDPGSGPLEAMRFDTSSGHWASPIAGTSHEPVSLVLTSEGEKSLSR